MPEETPSSCWRVFQTFLPNLTIMCRIKDGIVRFAPLYIHSFRLIAPRKLLDAQLFNQRYHSYAEISSVPDRLRWCRHRLGLMQAEVAQKIGVSRSLYVHMESGVCEKCPLDIMDKLAALYQVPVTDLLDEYNLFLYRGQGQQVKALRESRSMSVSQFAECLGVYATTVRKWEADQARMCKRTWELLFNV